MRNDDENRTVGAPARSLEEIVKELANHDPDHGVSCVCMDKYIREIRNQVFAGMDVQGYTHLHSAPGATTMAGRVRWILGVVVRGF